MKTATMKAGLIVTHVHIPRITEIRGKVTEVKRVMTRKPKKATLLREVMAEKSSSPVKYVR